MNYAETLRTIHQKLHFFTCLLVNHARWAEHVFWTVKVWCRLTHNSAVQPVTFPGLQSSLLHKLFKSEDENVERIGLYIHIYMEQPKTDGSFLDFKLSPCSEYCILSSG